MASNLALVGDSVTIVMDSPLMTRNLSASANCSTLGGSPLMLGFAAIIALMGGFHIMVLALDALLAAYGERPSRRASPKTFKAIRLHLLAEVDLLWPVLLFFFSFLGLQARSFTLLKSMST